MSFPVGFFLGSLFHPLFVENQRIWCVGLTARYLTVYQKKRVRFPYIPPFRVYGVLAHMGERQNGILKVTGSIPVDSTRLCGEKESQ